MGATADKLKVFEESRDDLLCGSDSRDSAIALRALGA